VEGISEELERDHSLMDRVFKAETVSIAFRVTLQTATELAEAFVILQLGRN